MKKVLIFSLAYYPWHVSGAEISIKEIVDRIPPSDIEFHLITMCFDSNLPKESIEYGVHVHRVGWGKPGMTFAASYSPLVYFSKILFVPLAALKALQLNKKYSYDASWALMTYMVFPIALAQFFGMRAPYIITLQEGDPFTYVFKRWYIALFRPLLRYGFRHAAAVTALSNYLAEWARLAGFRGEVAVIPNAVNTKHFSQTYPERAVNDIKDTLGKKMGNVFLITTSRLVTKNAVDDVIRALPLLPDNVHFIILGTGPDEVMLKDLTKKLGVLDRVQFVGQVGHEEMPKYLKASDIFIRPSRSEGFGSSFVEAMAAGLPVIATQEGGIADFLFDEKRNPGQPVTGFAVDRDNPEQIAKAVEDIMAHSEKVRAVVATAKQMVVEKYDWDLIAKDMREKVFARVL